MSISELKRNKSFDGYTVYYEHESYITQTNMKFSTFEPNCEKIDSAIIWLSGLTCSEENFITKAGAQQHLANTSTMIICPDTSPRGLDLPNEHEAYDFGSAAGFYVNAITDGYKDHYRMYDYITQELIDILKTEFGVTNLAIMGHSMGGHGALVIGLREQSLFKSVSAFSPIVNPTQCPWGQKAFAGYLNSDEILANSYDATELIKSGITRQDSLLIDQGMADDFLEKELLTENLVKAAADAGQKVSVKYREDYDHSYFYIASFIQEHIEFHLDALSK